MTKRQCGGIPEDRNLSRANSEFLNNRPVNALPPESGRIKTRSSSPNDLTRHSLWLARSSDDSTRSRYSEDSRQNGESSLSNQQRRKWHKFLVPITHLQQPAKLAEMMHGKQRSSLLGQSRCNSDWYRPSRGWCRISARFGQRAPETQSPRRAGGDRTSSCPVQESMSRSLVVR